VYPANIQDTSEAINLWVIVGSVIGALVVFVVLGVILWKVSMPIHVIFIKYLQIYRKARNIAKMIFPKLYSKYP
jgi:uncharacterized membrane protein YoaK (UPF0700 family)